MIVNLIIVGAFQNNTEITIDFINNLRKWNNPLQAQHSDIVNLINDIYCDHTDVSNVKCICLDPQYKFNTSDKEYNNIQYIVDYFSFGDTKYFIKNGHNIIIEFANILDEYFVTKVSQNNRHFYNNYKITWISCGCGWNQNLPSKLIRTVIENQLYTPTDCYAPHSLIYASNINKIYTEEMFQPYLQGLYQMLGSCMWRGTKEDNYHYEHVLKDFLEEILKTDTFEDSIQNDIIKFILCEAHWNELDRKTRKTMNEYIYGVLITIT
jgi:hypothetical protein